MLTDDDIEDLKARRMCYKCVGEEYLNNEILLKGKRGTCSYCHKSAKSYLIGDLADRIEEVFKQHYVRTSDEPDALQSMMQSDKESDYEWDREGESTVYAIMNAADIPEEAASDIQKILDDRFSDLESAQIGDETEFSSDAHYEEKSTSDGRYQSEWNEFEHLLKTEARFFSQSAARLLATIFEGIDTMQTRDGQPLITDAGPGTKLSALYRARTFQSDKRLAEALTRPDTHLGSPPSREATAGRMNARGISVFYGANDPLVALAEVRPPVGSQVAVARFDIIRPLRLLDLTAVGDVSTAGSVFDPAFYDWFERALFLRNLSKRIVVPVMPDDEPFEYLATQAIADFLATESKLRMDGIIFPSVQAPGEALNIVLFHKAAAVERLNIPRGTKITADLGRMYEEGWEVEYTVVEEVPREAEKESHQKAKREMEQLVDGFETLFDQADSYVWHPTLRIDLESLRVHIVNAVQFRTHPHHVTRHRWEKSENDEF